jgi:hypothetical protein
MKSIARLLAAIALAGGSVLTMTGTASATPGNCTITHPGGNSVAAQCTTGTGTYRVVADCLLVKPGLEPIEFTKTGPWVSIGQISQVSCGNRPPAGEVQFG